MRIAYIAPYKGPSLVEQRPVAGNLSLSNTIKIELVAKLLRERSHDVDVISMGEVGGWFYRFFPGFEEPNLFHPQIPVYYISSLPVRLVNGLWSSVAMLRKFKARHRVSPYDVVIIFNFKRPHVTCANYAMRIGLPVILEYEDDSFVSRVGESSNGVTQRFHQRSYTRILGTVSGCMAVSPHLLSQVSSDVPKLLLRGVVGDDLLQACKQKSERADWVLFSGTHSEPNGVVELVEAWEQAKLPGWQLHITGHGGLTDTLKRIAGNKPNIVFHGMVSREKLVDLLTSAKICINPHVISKTPGNLFAFKIIEYLAAGAHVMTTPMGTLEPELETGITYMPDNEPGTIARAITDVIQKQLYKKTAEEAAERTYGPAAISRSLDQLVREVKSNQKSSMDRLSAARAPVST